MILFRIRFSRSTELVSNAEGSLSEYRLTTAVPIIILIAAENSVVLRRDVLISVQSADSGVDVIDSRHSRTVDGFPSARIENNIRIAQSGGKRRLAQP